MGGHRRSQADGADDVERGATGRYGAATAATGEAVLPRRRLCGLRPRQPWVVSKGLHSIGHLPRIEGEMIAAFFLGETRPFHFLETFIEL